MIRSIPLSATHPRSMYASSSMLGSVLSSVLGTGWLGSVLSFLGMGWLASVFSIQRGAGEIKGFGLCCPHALWNVAEAGNSKLKYATG